MRLDRVTMTGADESIQPAELARLSERYPFVEWGILVSRSAQGSPRYPDQAFIQEVQRHAAVNPRVKLSVHLCGHWVRQLLVGVDEVPWWVWPYFERAQLNFHAERNACTPEALHRVLRDIGAGPLSPDQFIFQIDGQRGNRHLEALYAENDGNMTVDAVPLFDISGGAGVLPATWPRPQYMKTDEAHVYHGYAGGLGPENLAEQLPLIAEAAGDARIWIDMETRVRSNNDRLFDLDKVERCLQIAAPFIS